MLCPFCSYYAAGTASICPQCGKVMPQSGTPATGIQSIRQGRKARENQAAGCSPVVEARRQGTAGRVYEDPSDRLKHGDAPVYTDANVYDDRGEPITPGDLYRKPSSINTQEH